MEKHRLIITSPDSSRNFFRNVKMYNSAEKPKVWDIKTLCPELSDAELAQKLSMYFNTISDEFRPLQDNEIPATYNRNLPKLLPFQVAGRLRSIKKPRTKIQGDIFPSLVTEFADILALPLTDIYNKITETFVWPDVWKVEIITVIPKLSLIHI